MHLNTRRGVLRCTCTSLASKSVSCGPRDACGATWGRVPPRGVLAGSGEGQRWVQAPPGRRGAGAQRRGSRCVHQLSPAAFSPWPLPFLFLAQSSRLKPPVFSEGGFSVLRAVTPAHPGGHGPWLRQCGSALCSGAAPERLLGPSPQDGISLVPSGSGCSCPEHGRSFLTLWHMTIPVGGLVQPVT